MTTTPQKRSGPSAVYGTSQKVPLKGLLSDGVWHCNCSPRLPAAHFQVKKDGANKGRWFYTCQEPKERGCGLFLWDEEAKGREMKAVISNQRGEADDSHGGTPVRNEQEVDTGNSWIKGLGPKKDSEADEFGEWPLSPGAEKSVVEAAVEAVDHGSRVPGAYPETPRKVARTSEMMTPGSKRKRDEAGLHTPFTGGNKYMDAETYNGRGDDIFNSHPLVNTPSTNTLGMRSPSITPAPGRLEFTTPQPQNHPTKPTYDITDEVVALLQDEPVSPTTLTALTRLLDRHTLLISGIAKGRDITRVALKAKEDRIAELTQKIERLERERELDKTVIRHFKSDMVESVPMRGGGRGRGVGRS